MFFQCKRCAADEVPKYLKTSLWSKPHILHTWRHAGVTQVTIAPALRPTYNLPILMKGLPLLSSVRRKLQIDSVTDELIRTERILATARLVLALTSLLALYLDPAKPFRHEALVYLLVLIYSAHAISLLVVVHLRDQIASSVAWAIHALDVVWPGIIIFFTNGSSSPFFLFFIFALLGAAFRWGRFQALLTAVAIVALVASEVILLTHRSLAVLPGTTFDMKFFILRSAYVAIFAVLIGYLSESEKRRREQAMAIARISTRARVDAGLKGTLHAAFQQILDAFGAQEVVLIAGKAGAPPAHSWRMEMLPGIAEPVFTDQDIDSSEEQKYAVVSHDSCFAAAWRKSQVKSAYCLSSDGRRLRQQSAFLGPDFVAQHDFRKLLVTRVSAGPDLSGKLFLFEPDGKLESQLRFLQELTVQVTPAVLNVYLLRRLRSRTAAVERARVARDLHDGVIQSLHAIAFRLYALRTTQMDARQYGEELLELQELVQKEAVNIRALIQQLKPIEIDPRRVVEFLSGMVQRYRYDTGISADFVCDIPDLSLPLNTCRELARIVQEALANVLKHSGAENVLVRLGSDKDLYTLTIEDNGRGFEFAGRYASAELEKSRRGPFAIKERVRAIGGELLVESRPGQGSRLEITFPKTLQTTTA